MSQTKKKSATPRVPLPATAANGPTSEVLNLAEAAAYLRVPEEDVLRLVHEQGLPARQVVSEWRFLRPAIRQWLSQAVPGPQRDFLEASVGAWKDDPYAGEMLKDIFKRRGRRTTEGG
jgi:excisionase family DNA binding protein